MRFLLLAFGITLLTSLTIYGVLRLGVGLEGEAAFAVAGFPYLAAGHIYEILERRAAKENLRSGVTVDLVNFHKYSLKWYQFFILAVLLFLGSLSIISGYIGLIMAIREEPFDISQLGLMGLPANIIVTFIIGKWLGSRCRNVLRGILLFLLAVSLSLAADHAFTYWSADDDSLENLQNLMGTPGSWQFTMVTASGVALYGVIGCTGILIGSRRRSLRYLSFILKLMPASSRSALVSLAYEEAKATPLGLRL